ncbi:hypothetical protein HW090_15320 [Pseudomonas sp. ABC1]|uniref:hypothetical protein n=1 Tax=Pseudomonas sp. ABC1 TaxID=2748080 RepID=UPI0015C3FC2D|nr:hypothetical protein [Pseudomonas sp. ABC1]QLF94489.1 hypothetical protein HW090_15320 [Pseudomonas sp. ABC1]
MNNKLAIFFFCAVFLSACGETGEPVKVTGDMPKSLTAIYFRDGVGIDFGASPVMDRVIDDKGRKLRVVTYHLDSDIKNIDSGVFAILQSEGYERIEAPKGTNDLSVKYRNSSGTISFRYKEQVSEGLVKNIRLYVSWRI